MKIKFKNKTYLMDYLSESFTYEDAKNFVRDRGEGEVFTLLAKELGKFGGIDFTEEKYKNVFFLNVIPIRGDWRTDEMTMFFDNDLSSPILLLNEESIRNHGASKRAAWI